MFIMQEHLRLEVMSLMTLLHCDGKVKDYRFYVLQNKRTFKFRSDESDDTITL